MKLHAFDKNGYICTSTQHKTQKAFKNHLMDEMKKNGVVYVATVLPHQELKAIDIETLKVYKG